MKSVLRLRAMGSLCIQQAAQQRDERVGSYSLRRNTGNIKRKMHETSDAMIARRYLDLQRLRGQVRKAERNCALNGSKRPRNQLSHSERRPPR